MVGERIRRCPAIAQLQHYRGNHQPALCLVRLGANGQTAIGRPGLVAAVGNAGHGNCMPTVSRGARRYLLFHMFPFRTDVILQPFVQDLLNCLVERCWGEGDRPGSRPDRHPLKEPQIHRVLW